MPYPMNANQIVVIIFCTIMIIAFLHALKKYYLNDNHQAISFYSSTLTSLGILGTFTGIALGILYFDTRVIDASLILMIEGFKTAFITSIVGLTLSIVLKQITFIKPNKNIAHSKQKTPYILLENAISEQTIALNSFQENTASSIVNKLDSVVTNFNEHIQNQFGQNLQKVSSNFDSINTTIATLNNNISGFEEHVSALNLAVESSENIHAKGANTLKNLIDKITQTDKQLSAIATKTELNDKHFDQVKQSSEHITQVMDKIHNQFNTFNLQIKQAAARNKQDQQEMTHALKAHLETSQNNLIDAFNTANQKEIKANSTLINEIEKASQAQKDLVSHINKTLEAHTKANDSALSKATSLSEQIHVITQSNEAFIRDATTRLTNEFENIIKQQYNVFEQAQNKTQTSIQSALQKHDEKHADLLSQHYTQFDKQLNKEMQSTLEQLSKVMGFVSGEFARDFQQLINQMQSVKLEFTKQALEPHG